MVLARSPVCGTDPLWYGAMCAIQVVSLSTSTDPARAGRQAPRPSRTRRTVASRRGRGDLTQLPERRAAGGPIPVRRQGSYGRRANSIRCREHPAIPARGGTPSSSWGPGEKARGD